MNLFYFVKKNPKNIVWVIKITKTDWTINESDDCGLDKIKQAGNSGIYIVLSSSD